MTEGVLWRISRVASSSLPNAALVNDADRISVGDLREVMRLLADRATLSRHRRRHGGRAMTELPIVLCLEDCRVRIKWLRDRLRGEAEIRWTWRVSDFIRELKANRDQIACIVLDHDIPPPSSEDEESDEIVWAHNAQDDADGKCGFDAVLTMPRVDVPVLVWSVNGVGSERMMRVLRERGFRCERMPHLQVYYDRMEAFVRNAVLERGRDA